MKTMKKALCAAAVLALLLSLLCIPGLAATTKTAAPNSSAVLINGVSMAFQAYTIDSNNYFKLRDLAQALTGSAKQFEVGYDNANDAISITSGAPYTPVGGELTGYGSTASVSALLSSSKVFLDGTQIKVTAYTIGGYNYFKLRDLGLAINFGVGWDPGSNTITVDTSAIYNDGSNPVVARWIFQDEISLNNIFILSQNGDITWQIDSSGTYVMNNDQLTISIKDESSSGTISGRTAIVNDTQHVLYIANMPFYPQSGDGSGSVSGTWMTKLKSNGFIYTAVLTDAGTIRITTTVTAGTYTMDSSKIYIVVNMVVGGTPVSFNESIPYKISTDSSGNQTAAITFKGTQYVMHKK